MPQSGFRTVITFGTFDLFHIGHLRLLERAKSLGERLVVGVSTDELTFEKKGHFPVCPQEERIAIIGAARSVDETFYEESLEQKREYILAHDADCLVMGSDWTGSFSEVEDICRVVYLPRTESISTTQLEEFIKKREFNRPVWLRRG